MICHQERFLVLKTISRLNYKQIHTNRIILAIMSENRATKSGVSAEAQSKINKITNKYLVVKNCKLIISILADYE